MKNRILSLALIVFVVPLLAQPLPTGRARGFVVRVGVTQCSVGDVWTDNAASPATYYNCPTANTPSAFSIGGGSGTVTTFSIVNANGFNGSVANATTTPALTLTTTVTGVLKGNGTAISTATSGTDYAPGTSGLATGILKSTTSSGLLSIAIAADFPTLNQNTTGTAGDGLTSASGTAPLTLSLSSKALTGSISVTPANAGGAVALQATTPGTQQTGNLNLSGAGVFGGSLSSSNLSGTNTGDQTSVSGNAATASASDHTPTACGANTFAQSQSTVWSFTCASVSLTAAVAGILPGANGGTGNGFTAFTGPASSLKTFTLPNTSAAVLTDNAAVTVAQGGTGLATLTANNVLLGNGTSTPQFVAPGTLGNVLTSNGTTWASSAAASSGANTALSNLASVAINTDLITGVGTAAKFTATAPAQTSGSRAGMSVTLTGSAAVDGSSTHSGAAGGYVNLTAGAAVNSGNVGQVLVVTSIPSSTSVPALAFGSADNLSQSGLGVANGYLTIIMSGAVDAIISKDMRVKSTGQFTISSNTDPANADTRLSRCGVKCWQFGDNNDTGNTQDYIVSGFNTTSGTNTGGGKLTLRGGLGTGSGAGGDIPIQTPWPGSSGTTAQTLVADRLYLRALPKTLTAATATGFADINVPSGSACGGTYTYTVEANDGTDYQAQYGVVQWSAANKAGTVTVNDNTVAGTPVNLVACACTSGTLSETVSETAGASKFTAKINATSSLITPTLRASWRLAIDGGPCTVSPL